MFYDYDIAILGAGVLGYSTAIALKQLDPKLKIAMIDNLSGTSASFAAGAMLNVFAEVDEDTFKTTVGHNKFNLATQATLLWPGWIKNLFDILEITPHDPLIKYGTRVLYSSDDETNFKAIKSALDSCHYRYEQSSDSIFIPNEGFLNPHRLLKYLSDAVESKLGIDWLPRNILFIDQWGSILAIHTKNQEIRARQILITAGSNSSNILSKMSLKCLPIYHGHGLGFLVESNAQYDHVLRTPNRSLSCGINLVPRGNGRFYIGASNKVQANFDYKPPLNTMMHIFSEALHIFKDLKDATFSQVYHGIRPISLDGFPVIGRTENKNVWVLSGTRRDGLHCSPLYATLMASYILNGVDKSGMLSDFDPLRNPHQLYTIDEGIEKALSSLKLRYKQHKVAFSHKYHKDKISKIYELSKLNHGVLPELLPILASKCGIDYDY